MRAFLAALSALFLAATAFAGPPAVPPGAPTLQAIPSIGATLRLQGWSVCSTVYFNLSSAGYTSVQSMYGTNANGATVSVSENPSCTTGRVKFAFGNWYGTASPANEYPAQNDILASVSIWNASTGEIFQGYCNGDERCLVPSRKIVVTDDIAYPVTAGTVLQVNVWGGGKSAIAKIPTGFGHVGTTAQPSDTAEGVAYEDQTFNSSQGVFSNNTGNTYGYLFMLGFTGSNPLPTALWVGDSIYTPTADSATMHGLVGGYPARYCTGITTVNPAWPQPTPRYGCAVLARSGESLANFLAHDQSKSSIAEAAFVTTLISDRGTNDLSLPLATIKSYKLQEACLYAKAGPIFKAATLLPRVTSTDGLTTIGNQTQVYQTTRTGFNDWLRDGSSSGFVQQAAAQCGLPASQFGYVEVANALEVNASNVLTQDGGYWSVPSVAADYTGSVTTTGSSTYWTDSGLSAAANTYRGWSGAWSSGAANYGYNNIGVISDTAAKVIAVLQSSNNPVLNDGYKLWNGSSLSHCITAQEGTHPTACGHQIIANYLATQTGVIQ